MYISKRLKSLRKKYKLSQAQFAELIGVSPGNVATWELDKVLPSSKALISIAQKFKVSLDWLLLGKEPYIEAETNLARMAEKLTEKEKEEIERYIEFLLYCREKGGSPGEEIKNQKSNLISTEKEMELSEELVKEKEEVYLPLIGNSAAGRPLLINELLEGYIPVSKDMAGDRTFLVRAVGDSMTGAGIEDGDLVVIRPQPQVENGEMVLVRIGDDSTIKYFFRKKEGFVLYAANPKHKPIDIQANKDIAVIGKVIHIIKKDIAEKRLRQFSNN